VTRRFSWRSEVRSVLELLAATGFAITQPVLSVFGRSADVFINRDATPTEIVVFALVVSLVPTAVLWLTELITGTVNRRAREWLHVGFLGGLAALVGLQLLKKGLSLEGVVVVVGGIAFGVLFAWLYVKVEVARLWLEVASFAPLLFVVLFLASSSVTSLVFPSDVQAAQLGSPGKAPSVVMITFDEWPTASIVGADGQIDAQQFPNLARLAGDATWYRNETSVTTSTWYAVPTILTGRYPKDGEIPEATSHPESLFTFLGGTYRLSASETVTRLCPHTLCDESPAAPGTTGLRPLLREAASTYRRMVAPNRASNDVTAGFEERETQTAVNEAKRATNDHGNLDLGAATANRPERFAQFLDSMHADEKPTLHFLHILLPHVAYRYLPDGQQYVFPEHEFGKNDDDWTSQEWPPALSHERMLLQTAYVDRLVGELLDRLERTGLYDRSVVVITADHGVAFTPGEPVRGLSETPVPESLYPQLLWAPLIVKASGQTEGEVSDANVMTVDIMPTIAELTGFKIPWKVDGVPAGTRPTSDTEKVFMKATVNPFGVGLGPQERFDGTPGLQAMLAGNVDAITQPGDPKLQLYRVGSEGALVGRKVSDLTAGSRSSVSAQMDQLDAFSHVDTGSGTVPALVWGSADGPATVVVSVNGTVAGVSPTFSDEGITNRFAAMVPDALMRDGANRVELFALTGGSGSPVLHPMAVRQS
jgi:arylsulfatase A-like enzyme